MNKNKLSKKKKVNGRSRTKATAQIVESDQKVEGLKGSNELLYCDCMMLTRVK